MSGKSTEALGSEIRDRERLSRVILKLGMFYATGLWRTFTCCVLYVPSLTLLVDITRHLSRGAVP